MSAFSTIIGNKDAKDYFIKAIEKGHLSHSYILEGPYGVGKNTFAKELCKYILCEASESSRPCNECQTCHLINSGTHPDVIFIEKDTKVTKVENIRENIVKEMSIKPYSAKRKIIIVKAAETINIQGQNAMLKTIEEPPEYGIILLLCANASSLLPTIRSRCISVRFNPLNKMEMEDYLNGIGVSGVNKSVYAKLSGGSIGVVKDIMSDESYMELRKESVSYLQRLTTANLIALYDIVKEVTDQKDNISQILKFWLLWYRDIAVIKAAESEDLYYIDYKQQLLDMSFKLTYNKVSQNIEAIKESILNIDKNIYSTFVIENLLLRLKERKK